MPTTEYRQKFGCLNYHASAGSSFLLGDGVVVNPRPPSPTLYTSHGPAALPESLLETGSVSCTGVIHPYTNMITYWTWHGAGLWQEIEWSEECGGEALKQRILRRIEHPEEGKFLIPIAERAPVVHRHDRRCAGHGRLRDILDSERKRQTDAIRDAIHAACSIVWG
jgi:hypothetical protein